VNFILCRASPSETGWCGPDVACYWVPSSDRRWAQMWYKTRLSAGKARDAEQQRLVHEWLSSTSARMHTILLGTADEACELYKLANHDDVLRHIFAATRRRRLPESLALEIAAPGQLCTEQPRPEWLSRLQVEPDWSSCKSWVQAASDGAWRRRPPHAASARDAEQHAAGDTTLLVRAVDEMHVDEIHVPARCTG
jgi:hypothetical protein